MTVWKTGKWNAFASHAQWCPNMRKRLIYNNLINHFKIRECLQTFQIMACNQMKPLREQNYVLHPCNIIFNQVWSWLLTCVTLQGQIWRFDLKAIWIFIQLFDIIFERFQMLQNTPLIKMINLKELLYFHDVLLLYLIFWSI